MFYKIHNSYRDIVAICDKELIGKKFEENGFQLELKESFYLGEEADSEIIKSIINKMSQEDATFNIVGEKSIKCALQEKIITEKSIKKIQGIPFSLILA